MAGWSKGYMPPCDIVEPTLSKSGPLRCSWRTLRDSGLLCGVRTPCRCDRYIPSRGRASHPNNSSLILVITVATCSVALPAVYYLPHSRPLGERIALRDWYRALSRNRDSFYRDIRYLLFAVKYKGTAWNKTASLNLSPRCRQRRRSFEPLIVEATSGVTFFACIRYCME